jgi:16S rRNA (adenine1518-N6/adenine1519-N6)-dimethyltransferase
LELAGSGKPLGGVEGRCTASMNIMGKNHSKGSPDSLLAQTKKLMRRSGLRARKSLGQHFLVDEDVLRMILDAAQLASTDTVIEVGPGLGVLTRELAGQAGWVITIELDDRLADTLKKSLDSLDNVVVINQDVLGTDPRELLQTRAAFPKALSPYKVVANLPYYITSPVLRHFLEASVKPETMIVMVQQEVAGAIVAGPGQRSLLSISVQFYGKPSIVGFVPASAFYPPPEVDSAILKIDVYSRPPVDVEEEGFFRLVKAGFTATRKQAVNSFVKGLGVPREDILEMLMTADIDPTRRVETFTLEEWGRLWGVFSKERNG